MLMLDSYLQATQSFETILDFLRFGISEAAKSSLYYGHGTDNAVDDIFALILGSLHLPFDCDEHLLQGRLTQEEKKLIVNQLSQRIHHYVPVPYLIKQAIFCDLPFYIDRRVLIPRSPIAEMIKQQFSPWINASEVQNILDLCTGSGCIAIACHYFFPEAHIDAVDISKAALEVALINQQRHDIKKTHLQLIESDCWENIPPTRYDLIISNPPYVGDEEMQTLPQEYHHEPLLALKASQNGLGVVEKILHRAQEYLTSNGVLVVEVGNTEEAVVAAYPHLPFTWIEFENGGQGVFVLTAEQLKAHLA